MKILLISRYMPPTNKIAVVRPYNFAKYLALYGHQIVCITEKISDNDKFTNDEGFRVIYVPCGKFGRGNAKRIKTALPKYNEPQRSTVTPKKSPAIAFARRTAAQAFHVVDEYEWGRAAISAAETIIQQASIDLVLTTYGPLSCLLVGLKLKRDYPSIAWVSDMRDPTDSKAQQPWRRAWFAYIQKKMLRSADAVVTVSDGLRNRYTGMLEHMGKGHTHVYTIVNGYEPGSVISEPPNDGVLRIGYMGTLYRGRSCMDALFQAIKRLDEKTGKLTSIEVHYAGNGNAEINQQASQNGLQAHLAVHGMLSKRDSLLLQEKCDILCVLSWNTKHEQGVLTGKFPEYIRLRRPILTIISGELPDAELSNRNDRLHAGFSYEYGRRNDTEFTAWLSDMLKRKQAGEHFPTLFEEEAQEYAYPYLVKKLENILLKTVLETRQMQG